MTAGAEVVSNEIVRKVEIEEKYAANAVLDTRDLNGVGDVATVDGNVGGNSNDDSKDDTDESSYVFVSGGLEVSGGDPDDTGGPGRVNADDFDPKSDSADEVDQLKEEFGTENGEILVDSLRSETNCIDHGSITVSDSEVKADKDDVILENGSTVDPPMVQEVNAIDQDVNGHLEKLPVEEDEVVKSIDDGDDANKIPNVETEMDDNGSKVTFCSESNLKTTESSPVTVTVTELDSTADVTNTTVSNTDCEVVFNGGPESINPIDKAECQVTVDGCDTTTEDQECQVTADVSKSSGSPTEGQVSVYESCKQYEDLTSHVTADEPESFESPIKEQDCAVVSVDGSNFIDTLADNQECTDSVESEPTGNHMEEVVEKSEEHEDLLVITSEIKEEAEAQSENDKAEGTDIDVSTESEVNPESKLVLCDDTDDGILEMKETQISETEADRSELLLFNADTEKTEEKVETVLKVTESVEIEANSEEMKDQVKTEDEIQESQIAVTNNVQDDSNLEVNTTESAKDPEAPLETATPHEINSSLDEPQEDLNPEGSSESVELVKSECNNSELLAVKDNDSLSTSDELMVVEQKAEVVVHLETENGDAEDMDCGNVIENVDVSDDDEKETEVKDVSVDMVTENGTAEGMEPETAVENVNASVYEEKETEVKDTNVEIVPHMVVENLSASSVEGKDCETMIENVDFPDEEVTEVKDATVGSHSTLTFSDTIVNNGGVIEFGSFGHHETTHNIHNEKTEDINGIQSDEIHTSSVEVSVNDSTDVQNEETEVLPYNFLVKIPRCEDENLRDQIRTAQLQVDEKTRIRDAIKTEAHAIRAKLKAHKEAYNAAKVEETAARRLVRLKRQEIDSVQVVINRWKNAMSVEDIDARISNMEHMIQHETLNLKDEKQFIREIKQLKTLRDQLASNMGSSEEIKQAIDQKDDNEERMKTLRKELDLLKDKASKAETVVKTVGKTYDEGNRRERELQAQFNAADDVRQKAYAHLNSLRKLSYDKNKSFHQFKQSLLDARRYASDENKDKLYHHCAKQVETFMEQWNNNDEFRKEYVNRCNMNASRRQRPPVPDDVTPVHPGNVNEKVDDVAHVQPVNVNEKVNDVAPVQPGNLKEKIVSSTENNNRSIENVSGQKNQTLKTKGVAKLTPLGSDDVAVVAEVVVVDKKEEENTVTKEEIELAKKAEELRKEEIAAKLKEQRRLEEKAKAVEALERKKRIAEKAQIRAELRARKEAEQREKEREKRLRKKEKKKTGGGDEIMNHREEAIASPETVNEVATKDIEPVPKETNKKKTQPSSHFFSKQQVVKPKPIPPALVNRNKKRWQQWGKLALAVAGIFVLFLLGNTRYFRLKFNGLI